MVRRILVLSCVAGAFGLELLVRVGDRTADIISRLLSFCRQSREITQHQAAATNIALYNLGYNIPSDVVAVIGRVVVLLWEHYRFTQM